VNVAVHAEGVTKSYEDLRVLRGVSLRIEGGETVALLGPSGCGKTTFLRILLGLESPEEGRIDAPLGRAGYLPQGALLFPWKTALGNIELPLRIRGESKRARRSEIERWLPAFGLDGFAHAYPHQLSGGMQQRVALLRAVLTGDPVLVLDEPFGALDVVTRHRLQTWLAGLIGDLRRTMLFVTHDLEEAVALARRVVLLSERPATVIGDRAIELSVTERSDRLGRPFSRAKDALFELIHEGVSRADGQPV